MNNKLYKYFLEHLYNRKIVILFYKLYYFIYILNNFILEFNYKLFLFLNNYILEFNYKLFL